MMIEKINMMTLTAIIVVTSWSPLEIQDTNILFFNLDAGLFNPQKGQTVFERLISFRQPGQSREFF